jgi:hypothetical protein
MTENLAGLVQRFVAQHKDDRGALLPVLHDLQHELGGRAVAGREGLAAGRDGEEAIRRVIVSGQVPARGGRLAAQWPG